MLALMSIFGGIAYPLLGSTMRGIKRNQEQAAQIAAGRDALRGLTTHLRQASPLPGATAAVFTGEDGGTDAPARDRLAVTTTDLSRLVRGTRFTVEYFVTEAGAAGGAAPRLMQRLTAPDGSSREMPVGPNVVGLDCTYAAGGAWTPTWQGPALPEAVRLTVYVAARPGGVARAMHTEVNLPGGGF